MADYGLTSTGVNIKRLDTIIAEMHEDLTEAWGVNTQQNPESLINVLITNIADRIAELWELGQDVYNSQYPTSAEGMYLDNVAQFAGVSRKMAAPSYYYILCTGQDDTSISTSTRIASSTAPTTYLVPTSGGIISRNNFNTAVVYISALDGNALTVTLNGTTYSVTPTDSSTALTELAEAIKDDDFIVEVDEDEELLYISAVSEVTTNTLVLSENLSTTSVGSIIMFETEDTGDIYLPAGTITVIKKATDKLTSVVNVGTYIAGRDDETDTEYRQSYLERIFTRSARMVDSIRSAIYNNVQGVTSVAVYENDTDEEDNYGRAPHSIEVVVDGGDDTEIAQQILDTKAGGIATNGDEEITVTGTYGDEMVIRFNRPTYANLWVHVDITVTKNGTLPSNYETLVKDIIIEAVENLSCGDDLIPQSGILQEIYTSVYGVGYVEITMEVSDSQPDEYTQHNIYAADYSYGYKMRLVTDDNMIGVSYQ